MASVRVRPTVMTPTRGGGDLVADGVDHGGHQTRLPGRGRGDPIGWFRRRHLTRVPHLPTLAAVNEALAAADARDQDRRIGARRETVGAAAAREVGLLHPLPPEGFDTATVLSCRVDARARVCVRQSYYSVPARYAGRRIPVRLGAATVTAMDGATVLAVHTRSLHKGSEDLILDHYLEVLGRKPGALPGATALATARANGSFTASHQRYWDAARAALGDTDGTRALIGVLLLNRSLPAAAVTEAMSQAVASGRFDPDVVAVLARGVLMRPGSPSRCRCRPVPARARRWTAAAVPGRLRHAAGTGTGMSTATTPRGGRRRHRSR